MTPLPFVRTNEPTGEPNGKPEQRPMKHETGQRRNGRNRLLNTKLNARVVVTLALALAVVLAGCTSLGGSGGGDGEAGVAEANTQGGGGGADGGGGGADGTDADGAGDGADENADSENNELAKTTIEPRGEVWFNASKNGYMFEIVDAKNGSGTATLEPPANPANRDEFETVTYEGDAQFEQAYAAMVEDPSVAGMPIYRPLLGVVEFLNFFGVSDEDLAVGYENSTTVDGDTLTTKITGIESYGGVECYATEFTTNGDPLLKTCIVPYADDLFVHPSQGFPPYMALYDEETGELVLEIKLIEIREE